MLFHPSHFLPVFVLILIVLASSWPVTQAAFELNPVRRSRNKMAFSCAVYHLTVEPQILPSARVSRLPCSLLKDRVRWRDLLLEKH